MKKALLFLACIGCFISCDNNSNKEQQAPNVKVIRAEQSDTSSERSYSFISQPYRTTELSFRVGGPVYTFDTQSGQFFRKGELIAAIDDRDFLIRKQRAEAIYKQTEADYKRISNLYEKGSISGTSYEKAKADYTTSVNELKDTKLYAPFDGYIQKVNIERYQDIKASVPVVTFIDLSKIKVEAYIPEDMAVNARKQSALPCSITFNAIQEKTFIPEKTYITQSASDNNISYLFTAIINNADNSLLGGMAGSLLIPSFSSSSYSYQSVVIPQTAVCHTDETGSFVWLVNEQNRVVKRSVKTGKLRKNDKIDVLEESIQSLGELYYLKTENRAGLSKITVYVKKEIRAKDMQQLWDKLRRKVNDVQNKLPAGAGPSVVNDDFGDVLGVFYGLSSETHTYRELEDCAKKNKK